jgi:hypothetical protein
MPAPPLHDLHVWQARWEPFELLRSRSSGVAKRSRGGALATVEADRQTGEDPLGVTVAARQTRYDYRGASESYGACEEAAAVPLV